MSHTLKHRFFYLGKGSKQRIALCADALLLAGAMMTVGLLADLNASALLVARGSAIFAVVGVSALRLFGVYHSVYKYWSLADVNGLLSAAMASTVFMTVLTIPGWFVALTPVSVLAGSLLGFALVMASRLILRRVFRPLFQNENASRAPKGKRSLIYGAGEAGYQLATALKYSNAFEVVGFLDDSQDRWGKTILDIPIHDPESARSLIDRFNIEAALIAIPSADRKRISEIARSLESTGIAVRALPGVEDLVTGRVTTSDLKEVPIEDLLGRDPVPPVSDLLNRNIEGKSVMVTGAGGSIGSELCRQILRQRPKALVLLERSEYALYAIEKELRTLVADQSATIIPLLGSILDGDRVEEAMRTFDVDTVYHAAAYKHVPIVEANPIEGVQNNAIGTWNTLEAAIRAGIGSFVLISTDKAVRPTNVMGASKRLAELVLQAVAERVASERDAPDISMVRFGNVLGSSGSVVPLFREQIRRGGPVTLTHEDITRYFMTIPEAAQLVIQAGAQGSNADVFLLDMGDPVRIHDLAKRMIRLSGFEVRDAEHPDGDIEIDIVGLRPGEKLYEELLIDADAEPTLHPRIARANERSLPWDELSAVLDRMTLAIANRDEAAVVATLEQVVDGYRPSRPPSEARPAHQDRAPQARSLAPSSKPQPSRTPFDA